MRNEVAVYGKLVEFSFLPISWASTVAPIMNAKSPEKIERYKYSLLKKVIAPSVIFVPINSKCTLK
jgi:hypothetical protein